MKWLSLVDETGAFNWWEEACLRSLDVYPFKNLFTFTNWLFTNRFHLHFTVCNGESRKDIGKMYLNNFKIEKLL